MSTIRAVLIGAGLFIAACSSQTAAPDAAPAEDRPTAAEVGACGGVAEIACAEGQYCEYPVGSCGAGDRTGTCRPRPDACTMQFDPVCGCDGKTHPNACAAAAEGVSLRSTEPCPEP